MFHLKTCFLIFSGIGEGSKSSLTSMLGSISPLYWSYQDKSLRPVRNFRTSVSGCGLVTIATAMFHDNDEWVWSHLIVPNNSCFICTMQCSEQSIGMAIFRIG